MFYIDNRSRIPLYQQIIDNVERLAARGVLPPDSRLPSVRAMAVELSLNPNTVSRAYSELESRGIIYSLPGRGNFIAANSEALQEQARQHQLQRLSEICREYGALQPGLENWLELCRAAWETAQQSEPPAAADESYEGKGVQKNARDQ